MLPSAANSHRLASALLYDRRLYVVTSGTTIGSMAAVGVRDLKVHASDIIERAEAGEAFLVTRRGKPVAVVLPFGIEAEDLILGHAPAFIKLREEARTELRKGMTLGWKSVKQKAKKANSTD